MCTVAQTLRVNIATLRVVMALAATHAAGASFVMPWMCLERCGDNSSDIAAQLQQISSNTKTITDVAFEDFNLGPNSTLVVNNLTQVAPALRPMGVGTWAMVSSYPYPPDFLLWMRQVFANPQPFISALLDALTRMCACSGSGCKGECGVNIDWEPTDGNGAPTPTPQDAQDYAAFLDTLAGALACAGFRTSVCVATWSPIWNVSAIAATRVDYVMDMETYTADWATWQRVFAEAVASVPASKLVVGLETVNDASGEPFTQAEMKQRFDAIAAANITKVGIWRSPVPDLWWPFLQAL